MFNSQMVNTDPMPWHNASRGRFASRVTSPNSLYLPRPEFNNTPNPILELFRDAVASGLYAAPQLAARWSALIAGDGQYDWTADGIEPTPEHVAHAKRVLDRIAAVYGSIEVKVTRSTIDGAVLVMIDTPPHIGRVRVFLNDGTIWDCDPDRGLR